MSDARLPFRSRRRRANKSTANRVLFALCCFGYLLLGHLPLHCNQQRRLLFDPSNLNDNDNNNNDFSFFLFVQALEDNSTEHPAESTDSPSKKKRKTTSQNLRTKQQARRKNLVVKANSNNTKNSSQLKELFVRAAIRGVGGGLPGAVAGIVQVLTLMWIRTVVNYQYRYAVSFRQAFAALQAEGGIERFYRGVGFALIQNPLAKFGSTAANDMVDVIIEKHPWFGQGRRTVISSIMVAMWRFMLMPIDTCKTVLQVDSNEGFRELMRKVRSGKLHLLYEGAIASALSSSLSHWPWFYVYRKLTAFCQTNNFLENQSLLRNAMIGFLASVVSDTTTNVFRVIKTNKQALARKRSVGYTEAIRQILAVDGWKGLFGRGLLSKLLSNAIQSVVFTVVWRSLAERWNGNPSNSDSEEAQKETSTSYDVPTTEETKKELGASLKQL
mmetsp:Transcript_4675/g.6922  ORF Transcript_4675/g.6922 Transcript_4675/m.6922 type:complete len:442 (+) Transcript_4675:169-1494(+)